MYIPVLPDEFLFESNLNWIKLKRNSSGTTWIYEYASPPPNERSSFAPEPHSLVIKQPYRQSGGTAVRCPLGGISYRNSTDHGINYPVIGTVSQQPYEKLNTIHRALKYYKGRILKAVLAGPRQISHLQLINNSNPSASSIFDKMKQVRCLSHFTSQKSFQSLKRGFSSVHSRRTYCRHKKSESKF